MTRDKLRTTVLGALFEVLEVSVLEDEHSFRDMGMDSLAAVELRDKLQKALGVELHAGIVGDYPTVDRLTDYLATVARCQCPPPSGMCGDGPDRCPTCGLLVPGAQ